MEIQTYKQRVGNSIADTTLDTRLSALKQFKKFIGDKEPTVQDVEEWVEHMISEYNQNNLKASTIRIYYRAVASYWRAIHGNDNEIDHVTEWFPKNDVDHGEYLDFEELEQLQQYAAAPRIRAFIDIMYYYARRPGEVLLLNVDDVDFEQKTIRFNILKARKRSNTTLSVPSYDDGDTKEVLRATFELIPEVKRSLKKYINLSRQPRTERIKINGNYQTVEPLFTSGHNRMTYQAMYNNLKNLIEKAGISKNITPKSFRHTRATHLDIEGNDPAKIARQQLIHSPATGTSVIQGYVHERGEDEVREIVDTD